MKNNKIKLSQSHSQRYLEMAFQTNRKKRLNDPDGYGTRTGECGDTIEMFLTVNNDTVQQVFFETNGCVNTIVCANTVVQLSEGKPVDGAWDITEKDIIKFLGTLPSDEEHCAELAVGAFYLALSNYKKFRHGSWKKFYRTS